MCEHEDSVWVQDTFQTASASHSPGIRSIKRVHAGARSCCSCRAGSSHSESERHQRKQIVANEKFWTIFAGHLDFQSNSREKESEMILYWKAIEQYLDPSYSLHMIGHHEACAMDTLVARMANQCDELDVQHLPQLIRWENFTVRCRWPCAEHYC